MTTFRHPNSSRPFLMSVRLRPATTCWLEGTAWMRISPNASRTFVHPAGSGPFAVENPVRRPEKHPAGGLSVDVFPSVARPACSRVFFAKSPEPVSRSGRMFNGDTGTRGSNTCCAANNCERPVAGVSRETPAKAPKIPAGHGPAVRPTCRDSWRFPGRLAVRRAACVRPATLTSKSRRW